MRWIIYFENSLSFSLALSLSLSCSLSQANGNKLVILRLLANKEQLEQLMNLHEDITVKIKPGFSR